MKKRILQNPGLKLLSLFIAALVWIVIVNIEDPVDTKRFSDVEVSMLNESVITNDGKVYQVTNDAQTVDVTVSAKRSVLRTITKSDIVATADFEELQVNSLVPISISIPSYEGRYESVNTYPNNVIIAIEDIETKKLPLTAELQGNIRDGYFVEDTTVSPDSITISGPKSVIDTVSTAVAIANVSNVAEDMTVSATLQLRDSNDEAVDQSMITTTPDISELSVTVHVVPAYEIPITVDVIGEPADGYFVSEITYDPETIGLTGKSSLFEDFTELTISDIDISGATESMESVVSISSLLPDGISLANADSENVLVTIVIERYGTKTLKYPTGSITVNNISSDYIVSYPDDTEVTLVIEGPEADLEGLENSDITASIDLSKVESAGTVTVPLKVSLPKNCSLNGNVTVKVKVTEK